MLWRRSFLKTQAAGAALPFALAGVVANGETSEESLTSLGVEKPPKGLDMCTERTFPTSDVNLTISHRFLKVSTPGK